MLFRTAFLSKHLRNPLELGATWESYVFVSFYALETSLKIFGLGAYRYFGSGWNMFDFIVTVVSILGLLAEVLSHWPFLMMVRHLRILRLFKLRKRYRDVFGTVFILAQRLVCAGVVFMILYYAYAIVGMGLFAEYDLTNCCKNTSVEAYFAYDPNVTVNGYYYLNNFENLVTSYITLFELTVVNNWYVLMEGYAYSAGQWSRLYFMLFYLTTMLLLSIVVASVLDAFLFRISYKEQMSKEDEKRPVQKQVTLSSEECERIQRAEATEQSMSASLHWWSWMLRLVTTNQFLPLEEINHLTETTFTGCRRRTKDILLSFMYKEEIYCWMQQAEREEQLQKVPRNSRNVQRQDPASE